MLNMLHVEYLILLSIKVMSLFVIDPRCPYLHDIYHGRVKVTGYEEGSYSIYQCDKGYHLLGDLIRECLEDSTWSGSDPKCLSKYDRLD